MGSGAASRPDELGDGQPVLCRHCGDEIPEHMPLAGERGYCTKDRCIAAANSDPDDESLF
jgi:hypothetical protein